MRSRAFLSQLKLSEPDFLHFVLTCSRLEFALKRAGFLKGAADEHPIALWRAFGTKLEGGRDGNLSPLVKEAAKYIRESPPMKQVVRDGELGWVPAGQSTSSGLGELIELISVLRNNLMHGGKFPDGYIQDPARNRDLLRASVLVLDHCVEIAGRHSDQRIRRVAEWFNEHLD